jgi:hypothetical protein
VISFIDGFGKVTERKLIAEPPVMKQSTALRKALTA